MVLVGNETKVLKEGDPEPPLAPGTARIYSMRFCPWAERVLLYAAVKGIDAEIVNIDLHSKPEWFLKKNPRGQVPTFEIDGKIVSESAIVAEFLDGIYPESAVLPSDPYERALQRIVLEQFQPLWMSFHNLFIIVKQALEGEEKDAKFKIIEGAIDKVEKDVLKGDYFGGSVPSFTDWMVFPFFERIALFSTFLAPPTPFPSKERWPRLSAWWEKIKMTESIQSIIQPDDIHVQFLQSYRGAKEYKDARPDYDLGL